MTNTDERLAVFPTETVYGLGCRADCNSAAEKIFSLKERPTDKPLPILLPTLPKSIRSLLSPQAGILADYYWPGKITLVLPCISPLENALGFSPGIDSVAIRVSAHPGVARATDILHGILFATSANASGASEVFSIQDIPQRILDGVDILIDGGRIPESLPSTVVDCTKIPVSILRVGAISTEEIRSVLDSSPA